MTETTTPKCTSCKSDTQFLGQIPLRTGGTGGVAKLFFGEWAELGESVLPIDLFRCTQCGHLEFYDLDLSLPSFPKRK